MSKSRCEGKSESRGGSESSDCEATGSSDDRKTTGSSTAKLDKFNIDVWMENNASRAEARNEPRRRYFVSRVHHRVYKAGIKAGMPEAAVVKLQMLVRGKAGKIYDSVHNLG